MGIDGKEDGDEQLIADMVSTLESTCADMTNTFRLLSTFKYPFDESQVRGDIHLTKALSHTGIAAASPPLNPC